MRFVGSLMLLAFLSQPLHAKDTPDHDKPASDSALCRALCASARQDCRAQVQNATENDTSPVLSMNRNTNPNATATGEVRPRSQLLVPTEAHAFRARRYERLQACEVKSRICTRVCK